MNTTDVFTSKRHQWRRNCRDSQTIRAMPATVASPAGELPGVAIFSATGLLAVVTEQDAYRLANQIIDSLEGTA